MIGMAGLRDSELAARLARLSEALGGVQRLIERLAADNRRLREILRMAEQELKKRKERIAALEAEIARLREEKIEAKARVEQALSELDDVLAQVQAGEQEREA